ncbi:MAG TPA: alpha/beta hydrolase-fold protein [Polyangiaceae bacterium]|nr:alpha/beta hydrolase-fold protein [Polyangiaceae bacterium]
MNRRRTTPAVFFAPLMTLCASGAPALLGCAGAASGGGSAPPPSRSRDAITPAAVVSPEAHADGRVTLRLRAPHAESVLVLVEGSAPAPMNEQDGVWTITTAPLAPDWYGYSFVVDGVSIADPANPALKPGLLGAQSMLHVVGPAPMPWDVADVPHGVVHRHFYRSAVAGDDRDFYVYTPPGYEDAPRRRYPVLYLLHGFSDDASAWTAVGRANVIVDNAIANGKAEPMIVVMPLGYGAPEILAGGFAGFSRDAALRRRNFERFRQALVGEVVPRVEAAYRVDADRDAHAIAGLSMGGTESLVVGLNEPDRFAWIGAFSSGGLGDDLDADFPLVGVGSAGRSGPRAARPWRLLWISCGTDDKLIADHRRLTGWLRAKGAEHVAEESGGGHTWMVWRRNLVDFAALLFRRGAAPADPAIPAKGRPGPNTVDAGQP